MVLGDFTPEAFAFGFFTILTLGGGIGVVVNKNLVRGAVYLIISLFGIAGLFVLLSAPFLGYQIELVEADALRRLFATVFALMTMVGGLFAFRNARTIELSAAMAYASGAIGVSFAGDLITMFLFWEFMALFSTIVVWSGGTEESRRAGIRYGIMHLIGGIILKIGIEGNLVSVDIMPIQSYFSFRHDH